MEPNLDINQAYKVFLDHLKSEDRSQSTILAYGSDLRQLIDFLSKKEKRQIDQLDLETLEEFKQYLKEQRYTLKSISRKINSLRTFFRFLVSQKLIKENLAIKLAHPQVETKPPRILTQTEYRALRDACRHDVRIFTIVELLLQTGIRISELANLSLNDIQDNSIVIQPQEKRANREIPLNKAAKKALTDYLAVRPKTKTKTLFITKKGKPFLIRNVRTSVERYFQKADIKDAKLNDLRHTFIIQQLRSGVSLIHLSSLVGHKRLTTTEKYLKMANISNLKQEIKLKEL